MTLSEIKLLINEVIEFDSPFQITTLSVSSPIDMDMVVVKTVSGNSRAIYVPSERNRTIVNYIAKRICRAGPPISYYSEGSALLSGNYQVTINGNLYLLTCSEEDLPLNMLRYGVSNVSPLDD